jgi:hypothetical protein
VNADRLREVVKYDAETGEFTRLLRTAQRHQVGDRADLLGGSHGYRAVCIDGKKYLAHRAAWLYVHGEWPKGQIDHINADRKDNRLCNLRDVTPSVNAQNKRRAEKGNKSGFLGVYPHQGKWRARVVLRGRTHDAGCHGTPEEAHAAYVALKRKVHEGCTL